MIKCFLEFPSTDDDCRGGGAMVDEGGCLVLIKRKIKMKFIA